MFRMRACFVLLRLEAFYQDLFIKKDRGFISIFVLDFLYCKLCYILKVIIWKGRIRLYWSG